MMAVFMNLGTLPHMARRGVAVWLMAAAVTLAPSCAPIDTERDALPKGTLGDDVYGLLCDRLGASSLAEDLTGASFHDICHYDSKGNYGDAVDTKVLPMPSGEASQRARSLGIAKMERMAQRRSDLVRAFNAAFPDIDIPNYATDNPEDIVRLHDALLTFSQDITALYESNPYEEGSEPLVPLMTDAFGRLFASIETSDEARGALMRMAGRQGYRPFEVGLGAVRTMLGYESLRPFVAAQLEVLGSNGSAVTELQTMLDVVKRELLTSFPLVSTLQPYTVQAGASPNRPRTALEVGAALLLDQADAYAGLSQDAPRYITRRDQRGYAVPFGSTPGEPGTVPAPFVDADPLDGYADVDPLGSFITTSPLASTTPFYIPGQVDAPPTDSFGRPQGTPFDYVDTNKTFIAALARDLSKLMVPLKTAPEGDPTPWLTESEAIMYALSGIQLLAGPRESAQFDHVTETIVAAGQPCDNCSQYDRFVGELSPLPDLIHAAGQVLSHPDSDVIILGVLELLENHRPMVARLLGAALKVKEIADQYPGVVLPYEVPVWDQMAQVVSRMVQQPGMVASLLGALADPSVVQSQPPSMHFGETLSAFMTNRDHYAYDRNNINGPAYNVTDGYPSFADPHNLVDRTQPLNGTNRSMFERAIQMIYDGTRVNGCNKNGAKVYTGILIAEYWPLFGSYTECELFRFDNVGAFFLAANLPASHPKRAELEINDAELDALLNFLGVFVSKDVFLEVASGINGLTLHPSPQALARLLFFGALSDEYGQMPDYDAQNVNSNTAKFVSNAIEPLGGIVCPQNANGVNQCGAAMQDVLRLRDDASVFAWERLGFYEYLRPQLIAFADVDPSGQTGENIFLDLVGVLWRHWADQDAGSYCALGGNSGDPRHCSGAGINHYEPILTEALLTELIPALHEFAVVASSVQITYERGPKSGTTISGAAIIELITKILFDQVYAASVGMTDRAGNTGATWVDGTPQAQVTPFNMFTDALHGMDATFDNSGVSDAAVRKSKWKRARSLMVDVFLNIESEAATSRFANSATPTAMITGLKLMREQLNANCPNREAGTACTWASRDLGQKLSDTLSRPVFATMSDVADKINQHEDARRELQWFLSYALSNGSSQDALSNMLASLTDLMQLLPADGDFAPLFNAVSIAANAREDSEGPGCADRTIQVLQAMTSDEYDRYHVLDYVFPALVTPINDGAGLPPLDIILNAIADINREDAGAETPLNELDYRYVMQTLREFLVSETRGLQQLYSIVQNRPQQ
jgi:hypothetical protein